MSTIPISDIKNQLAVGDFRTIARCITIVENELYDHIALLKSLSFHTQTKIVGITGPPGAGKSTLVNSLITELSKSSKKIAVLAVDPTSPFNFGSLLGDRIRMVDHFNNPNIFIRSLAARGALGGLSTKIFEITDILRAANFDYIFIETVGVGQSEVDIAGLADTTVLVLVPEGGDEVQTIKSGIMEIADIYCINKADRPDANTFVKNIHYLLHDKNNAWETPVIKTVATHDTGTNELINAIEKHHNHNTERIDYMLTERAYKLIQGYRMRNLNKQELRQQISNAHSELQQKFNLYTFIERFY